MSIVHNENEIFDNRKLFADKNIYYMVHYMLHIKKQYKKEHVTNNLTKTKTIYKHTMW